MTIELLSEDFEGSDEQDLDAYDDEWLVTRGGSSTAKIDTAQFSAGAASCRFQIVNYGNAAYAVRSFSTINHRTTMVVSVRMGSATNCTPRIVIMDTAGALNAIEMGIKPQSGASDPYRIFYYTATTLTHTALEPVNDVWYTFTIVANDSTKKYTVTVTGGAWTDEAVCTNADFYNTATWGSARMGKIKLYAALYAAQTATKDMWFDNLTITDSATSGLLINNTPNRDAIVERVKTGITLAAPEFQAYIDNQNGVNDDAFTLFADVRIYARSTLLIRGRVEDIDKEMNDEYGEVIVLSGRGYASELMDEMIVESYTAQARSAIVTHLVTTYAPSLTTTGITTTADSITRTFKGMTAYEAIMELCEDTGYDFWVDNDLVANWGERSVTASGLTIEDDDLTNEIGHFPQRGSGMINQYTVYGDPDAVGGQPVVQVDDLASQEYYNKVRSKVIVDKSLADTDECEARGNALLAETAWVINSAEVQAIGFETLEAGTTIRATFASRTINEDMLVMERSYTYPDELCVLKLAYYDETSAIHIAELMRKMRKIMGYDIDADAITTRVANFYEDLTLSVSGTIAYTTVGTSFIAGHATNGVYGNTGYLSGNQGTTRTVITL